MATTAGTNPVGVATYLAEITRHQRRRSWFLRPEDE
ncbi:MAG TPA: hypothetical protein VET27_16790 [Mycobacterium sp.]|nr:hypothetical protein [Mycobacterium sp.]